MILDGSTVAGGDYYSEVQEGSSVALLKTMRCRTELLHEWPNGPGLAVAQAATPAQSPYEIIPRNIQLTVCRR
jgi:hypothetical protein